MKKLMLTLAIMAIAAGAANAQDNKTCDKQCAKTEQCQKQDCKKEGDCKKADCKKADCKKQSCEFEGLNLTDAQKEQIKTIKTEQRTKMQANREAAKAQKEAKKADRQEARKEYLAKIKAVLTPEQYVQYLENQATRAHKATEKMARQGKGQGKGTANGRFDKNAPRRVAPHAPKAADQQIKN